MFHITHYVQYIHNILKQYITYMFLYLKKKKKTFDLINLLYYIATKFSTFCYMYIFYKLPTSNHLSVL